MWGGERGSQFKGRGEDCRVEGEMMEAKERSWKEKILE